MPKKKKKGGKSNISVGGNIYAGRDVIGGDQYNYAPRDIQVTNVATPAEFAEKLAEVQAEIAAFKKQPDLSGTAKRNIAFAEGQVARASEEAKKEGPDGSAIRGTLSEAKETFDLLSGSIASAAGLGAVLGNLMTIAIRVFGG